MTARTLFLALALALPAAASEAPATSQPALLLAPLEAPAVTMIVSFRVGAAEDGDVRCLTRATLHALLESNAKLRLPALQRELAEAGASLRHDVGLASTVLVLRAPAESFPAVARRLLDVLFLGALDRGAFQDAVERAVSEPASTGNATSVSGALARLLVEDPRYSKPTDCDRAYNDLELPSVEAHARSYFRPANARIYVVGGFDAEATRAMLAPYKGGTRHTRAPMALTLDVSFAYPSLHELHTLLFPIRLESPRDVALALVVAELLDQALREEYRDKATTYLAGASLLEAEVASFLVLETGGTPARTAELRESMERLVGRLPASLEADPAPIERARKRVEARLAALVADPGALAAELEASHPDVLPTSAEVRSAVAMLQPDEVRGRLQLWTPKKGALHLWGSAAAPAPRPRGRR